MSEIPTYPRDAEQREQAELDRKFLHAMKVVFAYAKRTDRASHPTPTYHEYMERWVIDLPRAKGVEMYYAETAEDAYIALAHVLETEHPELFQ